MKPGASPPLLLAYASLISCAPAPTAPAPSIPTADEARAGVETFNRALSDATTRMDNPETLALWDEDGVGLLPATKPLVGKKAISAFMEQVMAQLHGAHMRSFEMSCAGIEISGDLATEYCDEHQVVDLGGGRAPFDGRGKMLFVLHRGGDGKWRIRREMWNRGGDKSDKE